MLGSLPFPFLCFQFLVSISVEIVVEANFQFPSFEILIGYQHHFAASQNVPLLMSETVRYCLQVLCLLVR